MTLLERDILAVVLSLNTVFMILLLPNVVPIDYSKDLQGLILTTLAWGLPIGALGVWINHWTAARERKGNDGTPPTRPPRRR